MSGCRAILTRAPPSLASAISSTVPTCTPLTRTSACGTSPLALAKSALRANSLLQGPCRPMFKAMKPSPPRQAAAKTITIATLTKTRRATLSLP